MITGPIVYDGQIITHRRRWKLGSGQILPESWTSPLFSKFYPCIAECFEDHDDWEWCRFFAGVCDQKFNGISIRYYCPFTCGVCDNSKYNQEPCKYTALPPFVNRMDFMPKF